MITKSILIAALLAAGLPAQNPPQLPFPDLVGPLKATPGCLGVETARTASGKLVIFAWFEDKKAVMRWYNSELHQQLVKMGGPPDPSHVPLAGIAEDSGPILAVASLTMSNQPPKGAPLPVSQIAIELYQPLPGGVFVGGRFAPNSVKVPGLRDFSPPPAK
jgi:antibiotic biosynthesis monooxygenase